MKYSICVAFMLVAHAAASQSLDALTLAQPYEAQRASSSNPDLTSNGDAVPIPPGETITLLDEDGPGMVTHFWNTIAAFDPFYGRSVVLRIYYDGNEHPSVQAPLGDFFGVGHGMNRSYTSLPAAISSHGLSRTCYWKMPFREHIRITLTNESPVYPVPSFYYYVNWRKLDALPEDTLYFHATYRQAMPAPPGLYTILDTTGRGHYVGTVYSVQQVEIGWFGEGDDFISIDGAEQPQLRGTGTEDYFNDAWGFREFHTPFHGVTVYEGIFASDRVSAYRWHVNDPIPFTTSFRFDIEHRGSVMDETADVDDAKLGSSTERPDWLSSVAFWYQYPAVSLDEPLPPVERRIAPYRILPVGELEYAAGPNDRVSPSHVGVRYVTAETEASVGFQFTVTEQGRYRIGGMFEYLQNSAVWQVELDGAPIGLPIDMVVPESQYVWHDFDLHDLAAGEHTLRFIKTDMRSPQARSIGMSGTALVLEYLTLLRLEDMDGYHELYNARKKVEASTGE